MLKVRVKARESRYGGSASCLVQWCWMLSRRRSVRLWRSGRAADGRADYAL
jgi:hypothetical protein